MLAIHEEGLREFIAGTWDEEYIFDSKNGEHFRDVVIRPEHMLGGIHIAECSVKQLISTLGLLEEDEEENGPTLRNKPTKATAKKHNIKKETIKYNLDIPAEIPQVVADLQFVKNQLDLYVASGPIVARDLSNQRKCTLFRV